MCIKISAVGTIKVIRITCKQTKGFGRERLSKCFSSVNAERLFT
jgi:hypothetical protein